MDEKIEVQTRRKTNYTITENPIYDRLAADFDGEVYEGKKQEPVNVAGHAVKNTLLHLIRHAYHGSDKNQTEPLKMSRLEATIGLSESTIRRAMKILVELGFLTIERNQFINEKTNKVQNLPNVYILEEHPWYFDHKTNDKPSHIEVHHGSSSIHHETTLPSMMEAPPSFHCGREINNDSQKKLQEKTTTTNEGGSGYFKHDQKKTEAECDVLRSAAINNADSSPVAPAALGQEEDTVSLVMKCGLTKPAAQGLITEYGLRICRDTAEAIQKNLEAGTKIEKSAYKYFRSIAKAKLAETPTIPLEAEIAVKRAAADRKRQAEQEARERKNYIDDLRLEAAEADKPEGSEAYFVLQKIVAGEEGWTADDRAMASECITFILTADERTAAARQYLEEFRQKCGSM